MAEYLIQDTTLVGIADAIRAKTGGTEAIDVSDMASEIGGIVSGGSGGGNLEGDFLKYVVYQVDNEKREVIVYGILWSQIYADTGKYDVDIPSTFGDYQVVIASEGVK